MGAIKFNFNFRELDAYLEGLERDYASIPDRDLRFQVVNTAQDEGLSGSTGLYYYPLVDEGRGEIVAKQQDVGLGVKRRGKLRFRNATTREWISTVRVRPSTPRRITEAVLTALRDLVVEEALILVEKGPPTKRQLDGYIKRMRRRAITEAKRAAQDRIPGGKSGHYRTRKKLYNVDVPGLADSFEVRNDE